MSQNYPLISVIIPVYNAAQYLHRCIYSVLNQSYQSLEIVLIDDGSTDSSPHICDEYTAYPHIKVCHTLNAGASRARKKGIELCSGEYVTFIDSDDLVEPDYVERLYAALQEQHTSIATCSMTKHREEENVTISRKNGSQLLGEKELHERFFRYEFWGFWGGIYSKSAFYDLYFPTATINEDYVVKAQLFQKYKQIAYVDIPLYHYMIHSGSLSHQALSPRMMEEWTNKIWCYRFYQKNAPQWASHAEAQVAETCCKLIATIGKARTYYPQKREMQQFLVQHCISLLFNKHLAIGIKVMMVIRILS